MKLNVLLVDDSTVIRKMLKRVLAESNLPFDKVLEAGDGQQALAALEADTVHLVLCDVNMPVMDGLEFLQNMRKNPAWQIAAGIDDHHRGRAGKRFACGRARSQGLYSQALHHGGDQGQARPLHSSLLSRMKG